MSVHGEFQRLLTDCVALLREAETPAARGRIAALERCAHEARNDLPGTARQALTLCAEAPPELPSELLREQHAERTGHLAALCRVILGEGG